MVWCIRVLIMNRKLIPIILLALSATGGAVQANEDQYGIESDIPRQTAAMEASPPAADEPNPSGILDSAPTLTSTSDMGDLSASSLRRSGEYLTKVGQYDKAIKQLRLSLQKNYDDSDTHKAYAVALEKKLSTQVNRDPQLFNQCVKEWLILLREEVGLEKLTFHGLNAPLVGSFFADETFAIPAKSHIQALTGFVPRVWETDTQFMHRVSRADSSGVSGKVLKKRAALKSDESKSDESKFEE